MIFCLAHLSKLGFGYSAVCVAWSANLNIIGVLWSSEDGQVLYERCIWTTDLSQHSHTWDVYIFHIKFFNVVLLTTITEGTLSHKLVMVWPCWQASNVKQFISFLFDNMKFKHFFFIVFFFVGGLCGCCFLDMTSLLKQSNRVSTCPHHTGIIFKQQKHLFWRLLKYMPKEQKCSGVDTLSPAQLSWASFSH